MLNSNYYNKKILLTYDDGSLNLQQAKQDEEVLLSQIYERFGLSSLKGYTHLDIGTCTGRYLKWAYNRGCRNIYGLDKSIDSIHFCQKNLSISTNLIYGCCAKKNSFKTIEKIHSCTVMFGTINHLTPFELKKFINILSNKMEFGGVLVFSFWKKPPIGLDIYNNFEAELLFEQSSVLNLNVLSLNGFDLIHSEGTNYLTLSLFQKYY